MKKIAEEIMTEHFFFPLDGQPTVTKYTILSYFVRLDSSAGV